VFQGGFARGKRPGAAPKGGQLSEGLGEVIGGGMAGSRIFFLKKTFEIYGSISKSGEGVKRTEELPRSFIGREVYSSRLCSSVDFHCL